MLMTLVFGLKALQSNLSLLQYSLRWYKHGQIQANNKKLKEELFSLPVHVVAKASLGAECFFFLQHLLNHLEELNCCCVSVRSIALSWITALMLLIQGNSRRAEETSLTQWVVVIFIASLGLLTYALFVLLDKASVPLSSSYQVKNK